MKDTDIYENRRLILDQLILLNNFEQEKYYLVKIQDYSELKRNMFEYDEAMVKLYELFLIQSKLEIEVKAKTVFGELGKFLNLTDNISAQTAEITKSTTLEILEILHRKKLELSRIKDRESYFVVMKIEEQLMLQIENPKKNNDK